MGWEGLGRGRGGVANHTEATRTSNNKSKKLYVDLLYMSREHVCGFCCVFYFGGEIISFFFFMDYINCENGFFFVCLRVTCSFSGFVHVNPMCFDPDDVVV